MKQTAIKIAAVKDMSREDWLQIRRSGIGGSDAATIVGLNPYSSKLTLYADKKGILPEKEDTERMRLGRDLEDYVAQRFCEETGKKVKRSGFMWRHPTYEFIIANIDREIVGEEAFLECKTTMNYEKHDYDSGDIPMNYYCQCMHYMAVTGCEKAYLAVLVFGKGFYWFEIKRDENEISALIDNEVEFWQSHVMQDRPPLADGSDSSMDTLQKLYPFGDSTSTSVIGKDDAMRNYLEIGEAIKRLEAQRDEIKAQLCQTLGNSSIGLGSEYSFSWKSQTSNRVDTKKLKELYPKVYEDCCKASDSRVFRIKKNK